MSIQRWQKQQQQRYLKYCDAKDISISLPLSSALQQDRIIALFWEAYLPNSQSLPGTSTPSSPAATTPGTAAPAPRDLINSSVSPLQGYQTSSPVYRKALLATALTTLSKRHTGGAGADEGAEWMLREGMRLYGESIADMSVALAKQKGAWKGFDLLAAARIYGLYEVGSLSLHFFAYFCFGEAYA